MKRTDIRIVIDPAQLPVFNLGNSIVQLVRRPTDLRRGILFLGAYRKTKEL